MQIVINIPTELYERLMESNADDFDGFIEGELVGFIQNGTPLDEKELKLKRWIEKDIETLNYIIESGWLISDLEKCTAIDACEDAITALKQYPVLDKVRAEIENDWQLKKYPSSPFSCGLRQAIEIIDKYRESEDMK